jgi:1,3-beta-glucan synthase
VIRYSILYFALLVVFVGLLVGPLLAKDYIKFSPPSGTVGELIQPVGYNNNDTRGETQTGTGANGGATETASDGNGGNAPAAATTSPSQPTPALDRRRRLF